MDANEIEQYLKETSHSLIILNTMLDKIGMKLYCKQNIDLRKTPQWEEVIDFQYDVNHKLIGVKTGLNGYSTLSETSFKIK